MNSIGVIIVAVFAVIWAVAGSRGFTRPWFRATLALSLAISSLLVFTSIRHPFGDPAVRFDGRIYGIFVTLEVVAIVLAVLILKKADRKEFLLPVIAFIVGAHFFGMVPALHANEFWWIGGTMCLLPLLTMAIFPERLWAPVVGLGCAAILSLSTLPVFR